jgi:hypothetical protein
LNKGFLAESATRGDQQRYRLGDPLVDEWDEDGDRQQKLRKQVKEFLDVEDKAAEEELEKVIKERKDEMAKEEKEKSMKDDAESPDSGDAEEGKDGEEGGDDDLPDDDGSGGVSLDMDDEDEEESEDEESESSTQFTLALDFADIDGAIDKSKCQKAIDILCQQSGVGRGKVKYVSHDVDNSMRHGPAGIPEITMKGPRAELEKVATQYFDEPNYAAVKREYGDVVTR